MSAREKRRDRVLPSGFFVLRTPLLAFTELEAWGSELEAASNVDDSESLAESLAQDRERLREGLRSLLARPYVREAIFLASPTLDDAIEQWREAPESDRGRTRPPDEAWRQDAA